MELCPSFGTDAYTPQLQTCYGADAYTTHGHQYLYFHS